MRTTLTLLLLAVTVSMAKAQGIAKCCQITMANYDSMSWISTPADKYGNRFKYGRDTLSYQQNEYGVGMSVRRFPIVPVDLKYLWRKRDTLMELQEKARVKVRKGKSVDAVTDFFYYAGQVDMLTAIIEPKK